MKVAIACGGTGGHIFPGLATARVLQERGHKVTLVLSGRDVESRSVSDWKGSALRVPAMSFGSPFSLRAFRAALMLWRGIGLCRKEFGEQRPDVLLAMGSYASLAPVIAASRLKIPVVLHEANAVPGKAIEWLKSRARTVAVGFKDAVRLIEHSNVVLTGFPVRELNDQPFEDDCLKQGRFTILVMGGSQGAHYLNDIAVIAVSMLKADNLDVQVIHLSGMADEENVRRQYAEAGVDALVFGFLTDMGRAYHTADIAISRSGASSCAELSVSGLPALLIPLPASARGHQLANARAAASGGGMHLVEQGTLTAESLADCLKNIINSPERLDMMRKALQDTIHTTAAEELAGVVERTAEG